MLLGLPRLDPQRYEHTIISIMNRMQMQQQFNDLGIEVHSLGLSRKTDITAAFRFRSLLRKLRPDILHTYLVHGNVLGRIVGRLAGVPVIIGSELTIGQAGPLGRMATKLTNPLTDAVEVNSITGGKAIEKDLGVPSNKIEVVLPGLDLTKFGGTENRTLLRTELAIENQHHLVVYVGRLRPVKGVEYGIRSFAIAQQDNSNLRMVLAGEGEQRTYLENLVTELGVADKVKFLGARKDLPDLLSAADSVIMPSMTEGFPRIALEAMAARKPIVATRVGGVPEAIIDQQTGILVQPKDVEAMASAIATLANNEELRTRLGNAGRTHTELNYSAETYVTRLDTLYQQLFVANRSTDAMVTTKGSN
jgi:glycosyltransferase involved in cell wall biosynthesis